MRVLLVDDDATIRRILGRLLTSTFGVELVEAENGVEGLAHLESDLPDLLVMDVEMPVMDGLGMLSAIRASPLHRSLPVVAVSAVKERDLIARMIQLQINDYLLKPLDIAAATKRLAKVIQEIRAAPRKRRVADQGSAKPGLLLIEPDPNFRQLFRTLLDPFYEVAETPSGPKGLKAAAEHALSVVCIAQGLGLLSENQLAKHLRELATPPSAIYLLHAEAAEPPPGLFDGQLKKSFVPEVLAERWAQASGAGDAAKAIVDALHGSVGAEVVTATQQTLGVMTQQEVTRLPESAIDEIAAEVMPAMTLLTVDQTLEVKVAMYGTKEHAERLAGLIFGETIPWDEGGNEAFSQLVETLGGRLRSCLDTRGIKSEPQSVSELAPDARPTSWAFRAGFEASGGERFVVAVGDPTRLG